MLASTVHRRHIVEAGGQVRRVKVDINDAWILVRRVAARQPLRSEVHQTVFRVLRILKGADGDVIH